MAIAMRNVLILDLCCQQDLFQKSKICLTRALDCNSSADQHTLLVLNDEVVDAVDVRMVVI
jgi:hypothetical protein